MSQPEKDRSSQHPTVREHPEQRRQQETGREDPVEVSEVGGPPSETGRSRSEDTKSRNAGLERSGASHSDRAA